MTNYTSGDPCVFCGSNGYHRPDCPNFPKAIYQYVDSSSFTLPKFLDTIFNISEKHAIPALTESEYFDQVDLEPDY